MNDLKLVLLGLLLIISSPVKAFDDWTNEDIARQAAVTSLMFADMSQTLYITEHPNEYHELNLLLGEHPAKHKVYQYFAASIIVNAAISHVLPEPYRKYWQYFFIGFEGQVTVKNARIGIGFTF